MNEQREKTLNALMFFASDQVLHARKTKLIKLLYFLDFIHFEKRGSPVTGMEYEAWEFGPVPADLWHEWRSPKPDFLSRLQKRSEILPSGKTAHYLKPKTKFNYKKFSRFELELMESLAKKHFKDNAEQMVESTHFETGPWDEIWNKRGLKNKAKIPYDMALLRRQSESDMSMMDLAYEKNILRNRYI